MKTRQAASSTAWAPSTDSRRISGWTRSISVGVVAAAAARIAATSAAWRDLLVPAPPQVAGAAGRIGCRGATPSAAGGGRGRRAATARRARRRVARSTRRPAARGPGPAAAAGRALDDVRDRQRWPRRWPRPLRRSERSDRALRLADLGHERAGLVVVGVELGSVVGRREEVEVLQAVGDRRRPRPSDPSSRGTPRRRCARRRSGGSTRTAASGAALAGRRSAFSPKWICSWPT